MARQPDRLGPSRDFIVTDDRGTVHRVSAYEPWRAITRVIQNLGLTGIAPEPPSEATNDLPRWSVRVAGYDQQMWAYVLRRRRR